MLQVRRCSTRPATGSPCRSTAARRSNGHAVARGRVLEAAELAEQMERQRDRIDDALEMFAENTIAHIRQERDLKLSGRVELPETRTASATVTC